MRAEKSASDTYAVHNIDGQMMLSGREIAKDLLRSYRRGEPIEMSRRNFNALLAYCYNMDHADASIGEVLVDESKGWVTEIDTIRLIREYLYIYADSPCFIPVNEEGDTL